MRIGALVLGGIFLFSACGLGADTTSLAQTSEREARLHYLAGDAALKTGDVLTAIAEWETTLRLKPSSEHTAKCLVAAAKDLSPDAYDAYLHMVGAADLERQGKLDEAETELSLALTYKQNGTTPQCLTALSLDLADLKKAAKAARDSQSKPAAAATATTPKVPPPAKSSKTAAKKKSSKPATAKKKAAARAPAIKTPRPPSYRYSNRYTYPTTRRVFVQGYYRKDGKYVRGHYVTTSPRPLLGRYR